MNGLYTMTNRFPDKLHIPNKYLMNDRYNHCWKYEKPFEENYPVQWNAFDSSTNEMRQLGWQITLEYNRAVKRCKLIFRNKESGLMCRVPFAFDMQCIEINKLYAVKNYKLRAVKATEFIASFTEDMIPELLDWITQVKKAKVSDFICNQKHEEAKDKVIELGNYLHNQMPEVYYNQAS